MRIDKYKRYFFPVMLFWLILLCFVPAGHTAVIRITHSLDYEPYAYVDDKGESRGILIDYWKVWAEKVRVEVEFVPLHFQDCIDMVRKGNADIVGGLYTSEERESYMAFALPVLKVETMLFLSEETGQSHFQAYCP